MKRIIRINIQGKGSPIVANKLIVSLNIYLRDSRKIKITWGKMTVANTKRKVHLLAYLARILNAVMENSDVKIIKRKKSANLVHSSARYIYS